MIDFFISGYSLLPAALATVAAVIVAALFNERAVEQANRVLSLSIFAGSIAIASTLFDVDDSAIANAPSALLVTIGCVGLISLLTSNAMLDTKSRSFFAFKNARRRYYTCMYLFWAVMLAIVVTVNLSVAWVLIEVSTGLSGILVAFSGRARALEAAWKYVVLTTLGLAISLLGITILYANGGGETTLRALNFTRLGDFLASMPRETAVMGVALIIAGLASKGGLAPLHSWLPDAHGEAPPPVSAMLSAAMLPTILIITWQILNVAPDGVVDNVRWLIIGFGLASLLVSAAFLSFALPIKRLLAYSSLEHMGILAIAVGIGTPIAGAAILIHIVAHGVLKSIAFNATIPLIARDRSSIYSPLTDILGTHKYSGTLIVVSLLALAGAPPSPLFITELMIVVAAIHAGYAWLALSIGILMALGFIGLARAAIRAAAGEPASRSQAKLGEIS